MSSKNERLAIELASASDAFEDDADPETVIRATLKAQLDAIKKREEEARQKQAELRADILGEDYAEAKAASGESDDLSEVEQEQQRLQEMLDNE
jgi:hypothetical protein